MLKFIEKIGVLIMFIILMILILWSKGTKISNLSLTMKEQQQYANLLQNKELYSQAIEEYKRLTTYTLPKDRKLNIDYIIANIYMEKLNDYENALAYYFKINQLYPNNKLKENINQKIVECLEKSNRSLDAQQELEKMTSTKKVKEEKVVALVGNKKITLQEFNKQIDKLPDYAKSKFKSKEARLEFLKNYIATEMMYETAMRKGYDKNKEIIENVAEMKKALIVQKLLEEEMKNIKIEEDDIKLYYNANKDKYKNKSFEEVKQQVEFELRQEKEKKVYEKLMKQMLEVQEVKIFDDIL